MVLGPAVVEAEFPNLELDTQASGYQDNEAAAAASIDPSDTAADLAAQGRLDGYALEFSDAAAFSSGGTGRPIGASISVVLFVTPQLAQASLQRDIAEIDGLSENEVAGMTFKAFRRLDAPDLGSSAVAGRLTINITALNVDTTSSFLSWQRGPVVASLGVTALDDEDRSSAVERLARQVDERIEGVLTGKIIVVAPLLAPTETPGPGPSGSVDTLEEAAKREGFDLESMVLALSDLPDAAIVTDDGFQDQLGAISSYTREFASQGAFMALGASRVASIGASAQLYASESDAGAQVSFLEAIGPEVLGQALASGFAESRGSTAANLVFDALELPPIGDRSGGFLAEFEIADAAFQGHLLFIAQGRILSQLLVIGPAVALEETVALARLMEARIRENTPG